MTVAKLSVCPHCRSCSKASPRRLAASQEFQLLQMSLVDESSAPWQLQELFQGIAGATLRAPTFVDCSDEVCPSHRRLLNCRSCFRASPRRLRPAWARLPCRGRWACQPSTRAPRRRARAATASCSAPSRRRHRGGLAAPSPPTAAARAVATRNLCSASAGPLATGSKHGKCAAKPARSSAARAAAASQVLGTATATCC